MSCSPLKWNIKRAIFFSFVNLSLLFTRIHDARFTERLEYIISQEREFHTVSLKQMLPHLSEAIYKHS